MYIYKIISSTYDDVTKITLNERTTNHLEFY